MAADLTVAELREFLRSVDAATHGNKAELIVRIERLDADGELLQHWLTGGHDSDDASTKAAAECKALEVQEENSNSKAEVSEIAEIRSQMEELRKQMADLIVQLQCNSAVQPRGTQTPAFPPTEMPPLHQPVEARVLSPSPMPLSQPLASVPSTPPQVFVLGPALDEEPSRIQPHLNTHHAAATHQGETLRYAAPRLSTANAQFDTDVAPRISINSISELLGVFDGNGDNFEIWARQLSLIRNSYRLTD